MRNNREPADVGKGASARDESVLQARQVLRRDASEPPACQVLIVEDEGLVAKHLARSLIRLGYHVVGRAATGVEALRLATLLRPDIVLMDICLRGQLDGVATAARLQERAAIPVIFLTAFSDNETIERAMSAQPFGYVVKPFQEVALRCALEIAMKRQRMEEAVRASEQAFRRLSSIDELTGLPNRRGFSELASQQLKVARRYHQPLVLCFADLDGLKKINDTLGHAVGDRAICAAARVLRETFRGADIVGRLSGDEFAVLAIAGTQSSLDTALKRLAEHLATFNATTEPFALDISVGIVQHDADLGECLEELLGRADAAMYEEKQRKRSCSGMLPGVR